MVPCRSHPAFCCEKELKKTQVFTNLVYDYVCLHTSTHPPSVDSDPPPATGGLSAGTIVGISIIIFLVSFSAGVLLAALITYCCCVKRREKSSGQPQVSSSEAPVYDEVVAGELELKENVAYGPVETLEMEQNPSYGPV